MKIESENFEYLFSNAYDVFGADVRIVHQLSFIYFARKYFCRREQFSQNKAIEFKKEFLAWQNNVIPNMDWISGDYGEWVPVKEFSHDDDFTWNSMDKYIIEYVMEYMNESRCVTYQEHLLEEYRKSNVSDFMLVDHPHPDMSVYE